MSRIEHDIEVLNPKTGIKRNLHIVYGYDRPMQEYFLQIWNKDDKEAEEPIAFAGSKMTGAANSEMYYLYFIYGVPDEHLQQVALDLPF